MRADVKIQLKASKELANSPHKAEIRQATNLISKAVKNVLLRRYGAAEMFDPATGEPVWSGVAAPEVVANIQHVSVQAPSALLAILQKGFTDPDLALFTSEMPTFDSAATEDVDRGEGDDE